MERDWLLRFNGMLRSIPNALTLFRGALFPFIAYEITQENFVTACILFLIGAITDALDGYLARKFGWESMLGKILDRIVDKPFFVGTLLFIGMAFLRMHPALDETAVGFLLFLATFLLLIECLLLLNAARPTSGKDPSSNIWGKAKVFNESVVVLLFFWGVSSHHHPMKFLMNALITMTGASLIAAFLSLITHYRDTVTRIS